ncbi:MAG: hypothetical protein Q8859_06335 [Bacteroidota bacterium]|nr:hypothetical protein [Bacteroidota bacterium]
MNNVKFLFGEEIDHRIKTRFIFHFKNSFHVNLDNYSKITKWIDATNYKGFYGTISGMSFSNGKGENQILFDYGYPALPLLFLEYKANGSFYTIQIWSDKPFDEKKIINILNLK